MVRSRKKAQEAPSARPTSTGLDVNAVVSYNVKAIRERRGWTQQSVAERLGRITGHQLPQASISAMERGSDGDRRRRFDAHELYLLSVVFNVPIAYFFIPPPGTGSEKLADTGDDVSQLYAALLGHEDQLVPLDERLEEIKIKNPEESDAISRRSTAPTSRSGTGPELPDVAEVVASTTCQAEYGDRLDEVALFLKEFATKIEVSGPAGYLQSMAHRHGEVPLNDPDFDINVPSIVPNQLESTRPEE